ncbi:Pleckstrin homology domain-containing protein [Geopyxis carbonaria]|nr:Pleckstrin homology domain-containing protein [Geopyxis carbonaria]
MNIPPSSPEANIFPTSSSQNGRLDPGSYTTHRLHHATPPHLHITSRRVFVGPIPLDWIKNHRSEWYKQHIHYSKRRATFSAPQNTSRSRRLSNLEQHDDWWTGSASSTEATNDGEQEIDELSDPLPIPVSSDSTLSPTATQRPHHPRSKTDPTHISPISVCTETTKARPRTAETFQSLATAPTGPSSPVRPSWLDRGESFATANEGWDHYHEHRHSKTRNELTEEIPQPMSRTSNSTNGTVADNPDLIVGTIVEIPGPRSGSDTGASTISAPHSVDAANSIEPLLKTPLNKSAKHSCGTKNMEGKCLPDTSPAQLGYPDISQPERKKIPQRGDVESGSSARPTTEQKRVSTNKDRISGGLVRFNTAVDARERDKRLQQKLADLSRTRTIRRGGRRLSHIRKREGEIIKMESMLVRVETVQTSQIPEDYDENENLKIQTRLVDKWREYVVVCREGADDNVPMTLRLYKSRTIPAVDKVHVSSRSTREIPLNPKTTKVNVYSSLDKTLVVWLPFKNATLIYIMRPRCSSASVEWYTFLSTSLGERRLQSLQIAVPDLSLTLRIDNPFERLEQKLRPESCIDDATRAKEERDVAKNLMSMSMEMLEGVKEWADIIEHWSKNERMGLAWRRYDRLEWIHGANEHRMHGSIAMQKTHELELRPKIHYPTEVSIDGEKLKEPPPVEGFLVRLTSGEGKQERFGRRTFQKRMYFTTHDQYLCFCRPARALPPAPPSKFKNGRIPTPDEIAEDMPLIYSVTPYQLDGRSEIEWLSNNTPEGIDIKDKEAYEEAERKVNTLLKAEGFVDLCKVTEVRIVRPRIFSIGQSMSEQEVAEIDDTSFELALDNGLVLKLQSYCSQTRDEWVLRLADLVKYWKMREIEDLAIVRRTRATNLAQLNVDEEMESIMGQYARKWEVSRTVASSELYNVCGLSSCRAITMSGVLYRKPRRHSTFRRYNVILCHGELIVFHNSCRGSTGKEYPTVYQERHVSLSLTDCYIYSGLVTESDLLYQNQTFDSNSPGRHTLPRIYPDGYTSYDEDTMTCFVLWHGTRRSLFTTKDDEGKTIRHRVPQLGTKGRAIVFKARSRLERDTWVMSIAMEIDRLNSGLGEEIKVTPPKGNR